MVRERLSGQLDAWLEVCTTCGIEGLRTFATGLRQDYQAVKAALETAWSNGQTEGQVNRL